ncbi:MAG: S-layer homology domain-containing protein [Clostridia bacterium]|nr:S-layer homology domain-containing protein [Clostridia bacterium]
MIKKITACILSACLLVLSGVSSLAITEGLAHKAASMLNDIDRSIVTASLPMVVSDSGLDMLDAALKKHEKGEDPGMIMGPAIEMALGYVDADTLGCMFDSLRLFSEDFRETCQDIYQNVKAMKLTSTESKGAELFLSLVYQKEAALRQGLEKHQISPGVLANLLEAYAKENGSQKLMTWDGTSFSVGYTNATLARGLNAIWQGKDSSFDVSEISENLVSSLNARLSQQQKEQVLPFLRRIDFLAKGTGTSQSGGGQGGAAGGTTDNEQNEPVTPLPSVQVAAYQLLETVDGLTKEQVGNGLLLEVTAAGLLALETQMASPVVYAVSGSVLSPVKMALKIDGKLLAEVSQGVYLVKEAEDYFTDCNDWGKPYVEALYARRIINGKAEKQFFPNDTITREEFVKLVAELFGLKANTTESGFRDVPQNAWYAPYVAAAKQYGFVNGISGSEFGVGMNIKRQDMVKIISQILTAKGLSVTPASSTVFADYASIAPYAQPHALSAYAWKIVSGDDNRRFNPNQFATRKEAAKMVYGMVQVVLTRGQ